MKRCCQVTVLLSNLFQKDGQQRFIARHQVASIEPLATIREPGLPALFDETDPFEVLGVRPADTLERAMAAFHTLLQLYSPERWAGENIPFEFNRYAAEKTRQLNMAFTAVRAEIQAREEQSPSMVRKKPFFGVAKAAG